MPPAASRVVGQACRPHPVLVSGRFPNELERELALVDGYVSKDRLDDLPIAVKAVLGLV